MWRGIFVVVGAVAVLAWLHATSGAVTQLAALLDAVPNRQATREEPIAALPGSTAITPTSLFVTLDSSPSTLAADPTDDGSAASATPILERPVDIADAVLAEEFPSGPLGAADFALQFGGVLSEVVGEADETAFYEAFRASIGAEAESLDTGQ